MPSSRGLRSSDSMMTVSEQLFSKSLEELRNEPFAIVSFEYAVQHKSEFIPCEVAVVQFTIAGGIQNYYHAFINPKPLPPGFYAEAKQHSEDRHQIPMMGNFEHWNNDFDGISNKIMALAITNMRLFVKSSSDIAVTNSCLFFLSNRSRTLLGSITVTPLEELVKCIYDKYGIALPMTYVIPSHLEMSTHDFDPNIRCAYHDNLDCFFCASGFVYRLYYNFNDLVSRIKMPASISTNTQNPHWGGAAAMPAVCAIEKNFTAASTSHVVGNQRDLRLGRANQTDPEETPAASVGNSSSETLVADVSCVANCGSEKSFTDLAEADVPAPDEPSEAVVEDPRYYVEVVRTGVGNRRLKVPKTLYGLNVEPVPDDYDLMSVFYSTYR